MHTGAAHPETHTNRCIHSMVQTYTQWCTPRDTHLKMYIIDAYPCTHTCRCTHTDAYLYIYTLRIKQQTPICRCTPTDHICRCIYSYAHPQSFSDHVSCALALRLVGESVVPTLIPWNLIRAISRSHVSTGYGSGASRCADLTHLQKFQLVELLPKHSTQEFANIHSAMVWLSWRARQKPLEGDSGDKE